MMVKHVLSTPSPLPLRQLAWIISVPLTSPSNPHTSRLKQTEVKNCTTLTRDQSYHLYFSVHLAYTTLTLHFQDSVTSTTVAEETSDKA